MKNLGQPITCIILTLSVLGGCATNPTPNVAPGSNAACVFPGKERSPAPLWVCSGRYDFDGDVWASGLQQRMSDRTLQIDLAENNARGNLARRVIANVTTAIKAGRGSATEKAHAISFVQTLASAGLKNSSRTALVWDPNDGSVWVVVGVPPGNFNNATVNTTESVDRAPRVPPASKERVKDLIREGAKGASNNYRTN